MIDQHFFTLQFPKFSSRKVNYRIKTGLHVIYGESGVGKSDLIRHMLGSKSRGQQNYRVISKNLPSDIQIIFQNPDNQIVCATIARELAFSIECNLDDSDLIHHQYKHTKKLLPFAVDVNRHPATLSGGEQELLNIVNALSTRPDLLLIDDGMSFLSDDYKLKIVKITQDAIRESNSTVIWFSSEASDAKFGETVWKLSLNEFMPVNQLPQVDYPQKIDNSGQLSVNVVNLIFKYNNVEIFRNFNFKTEGCRSFGIEGSNGCGKTTLAQIILGMIRPQSGSVKLAIGHLSKRPLIGYLDQFPERMLGMHTLTTFAGELIDNGFLLPERFDQARRRMPEFQLAWDYLSNRDVSTISWSTLRFVLIILLTHCRYELLVLDEPTFGLGQNQRLKLIAYLQEYLNRNYLILISHDQSLISSLCDASISLEHKQTAGKTKIKIEES